jgi:hypothetical protein
MGPMSLIFGRTCGRMPDKDGAGRLGSCKSSWDLWKVMIVVGIVLEDLVFYDKNT